MSLFTKIKSSRPKRNKFDLSHERKMTLKQGELIPMMVQEVVPGDSFRVNSEIMMRYMPMLAPMMQRVDVTTHYFFVPNRLVWSEWEDFITGGRDGQANPVSPYLTVNNANKTYYGVSSLADYLGFPPVVDPTPTMTNSVNISALPFRAYQLIYNEYYRDQNLQADLDVSVASGLVSGPEIAKLTQVRRRAWGKDYFTSALPFAQRGGAVSLPFEGDATVNYSPTSSIYTTAGAAPAINTLVGTGDGTVPPGTALRVGKTAANNNGVTGRIENISSIDIDGSTVTINELRRSIRLQEWLEKNARGGARYIEQILSHFGVISSDARLQRPEYLGGGQQPLTVSEVLSTFQDPGAEGNPQGNMAGHGISVGNTHGFKKTFEEHGYIIGIMSVLPKAAYQQGIPKHFRRYSKFDHYWPEFANIGEQEVQLSELWFNPQGIDTENNETFGYQSRYAEYKYQPDTVHGDFRTSLNFWHQGRIFSAKPVLNESFVTADPTNRIFAVPDPENQHLLVQLYNNISALRPMPYFGTPTL